MEVLQEGIHNVLGQKCIDEDCLASAERIGRFQTGPWTATSFLLPGRREHLYGLLICLLLTVLGSALKNVHWRAITALSLILFFLWLLLPLGAFLGNLPANNRTYSGTALLIFSLATFTVLHTVFFRKRRGAFSIDISLAASYITLPILPALMIGTLIRPEGTSDEDILSIISNVIVMDVDFAELSAFTWVMLISPAWTLAFAAFLEPLARRWAHLPR
ncbi:MAG TPA: hypothetical protein VGB85_11285 [Nannocystis sp.]